ncbi:hypothetical protein BP6252_02640 [Coleophoma cylindrospora]|uniref:Telomere length regulation protein conserved domain-containing protein n=1 Tax=Coleophoma cylindrospora TaxID=1849047 RepID=A0A3D8SFB8_9HELO|nr:hypothetical protein BP6252_02640 [Coleophoma cylindrospora]
MDGLLNPVSTISYKDAGEARENLLVEVAQSDSRVQKPAANSRSLVASSTPQDILEVLRNTPNHDSLMSALKLLSDENATFKVTDPSPLAAQIIHVLVSDVIPNYWHILGESRAAQHRKTHSSKTVDWDILVPLRSVPGLSAILLRLKELIQTCKEHKNKVGGPDVPANLDILLQLVTAILTEDDSVLKIWDTLGPTTPKQKALRHEFLGLFGSGKLLGICAEAEDIVNDGGKSTPRNFWIANGALYSEWLGSSITRWAKSLPVDSSDAWKCCGELLSKAFRLGNPEKVLREIVSSLLLQTDDKWFSFSSLIDSLPSLEQKNLLQTLLKLISKDYFSATVTSEDDSEWWKANAYPVSGAANLISRVISTEQRKEYIIDWLTGSSGAGIGDGIAIRRAVVVSISNSKNDLETVLEKSLQQFGDQLYIRHTPTLQQEVHAQVLLLSAGYIHRRAPLRLAILMRSGVHLNAVSNRLAASSPRARFLGMVVGEALSSLVDKADNKMDFKVDEMSTAEAKWFKSLVFVQDTIGSLDALKSKAIAETPKRKDKPKGSKGNPIPKPNVNRGTSKIVSIEEIEDDEEEGEESDDDGLVPYAKPDSDAEDSDEDPTLINRNKPTAPVYVRDLITYFRDIEDYDKQKLALATAPSLIRRKANFGTEVSSHAEELATLLVGLQDKYDMEDFADMRLQGMIAILVSQPQKMGPWFSKTFFDGDYSLSQRASVLTTIGLGARELGGFGSADTAIGKQSESFASKALPEKMQALYAPQAKQALSALESLSTDMTRTMIAPMATSLADRLTGPDILKVRTFSSRLEVESRRKKPVTNTLAALVSNSFFFPLTGRFFIHLKAYGSSRANVVFQPHLLSLFIKTLSLLLHFSGPSTLSLPQMTSEFWDLLLSLRMQAVGDIIVVESILFAFMTILEMNEDKRRLVEVHGRQLLETQQWVEGIFSRTGSGGSEEDMRIRTLAAAALVRIGECVEKYQALLMGDLASFRG